LSGYLPLVLVLAGTSAVVLLAYGVSAAAGARVRPVRASPFMSGGEPAENAMSRYHARWYAMSLVFLAFDVEMLFMYPWAVVVASVGWGAVVEMFGFLLVLLAGVVYAWREGALRWA